MVKTDHPKLLLYIEPSKKEKTSDPCVDGWIELLKYALKTSKRGAFLVNKKNEVRFGEGAFYRGNHTTDCGENSKNFDYLLENGMITNTLSKYYLIWYRNSIPETEWIKLKNLAEFFHFNTNISFISVTNKKLHSSSLLRILDIKSWMDGGSLTIKFRDYFDQKYIVEFHQSASLSRRMKLGNIIKLPGRMYLDHKLIEERSDDEKILLDLLERAIDKSSFPKLEDSLLREKIEYVRSDQFLSNNQIVREMSSK